MSKIYKSVFTPDVEIDLANYLTELMISNFIDMKKWTRPSSPFWRKDISDGNPILEELGKRYGIELSAMKNLLKVFDGDIIAKYIIENRKVGFKLLKKENQAIFLYDVFNLQIKKPDTFVDKDIKAMPTTVAKSFSTSKNKIAL